MGSPITHDSELRRIVNTAVNEAYTFGFRACIQTIAETRVKFPQMDLTQLLEYAAALMVEFEAQEAQRHA